MTPAFDCTGFFAFLAVFFFFDYYSSVVYGRETD
jgi:hypothetical protein